MTPSGNSLAARNLLRLHNLTFDRRYVETLKRLLSVASGDVAFYPSGYAMLMMAVDYNLDRSKEVAVVGKPEDPMMLKIRKYFFESFIPNEVLAMGEPVALDDSKYPAILQGKGRLNDQPTIYICENNICKRPTTSLEEAEKLVNDFEKYKP